MKKKQVMLVDDNPVNLRMGKNMLSVDYDMITAGSALRMFELLKDNAVDLILLDIDMPEMNGITAIKILKEKPETKDIPVIFLTGMAEADYVREACTLGADDFIAKPFDLQLLLKRIALQFGEE